MTPGEVAALFRVDPKTVTKWARAGNCPPSAPSAGTAVTGPLTSAPYSPPPRSPSSQRTGRILTTWPASTPAGACGTACPALSMPTCGTVHRPSSYAAATLRTCAGRSAARRRPPLARRHRHAHPAPRPLHRTRRRTRPGRRPASRPRQDHPRHPRPQPARPPPDARRPGHRSPSGSSAASNEAFDLHMLYNKHMHQVTIWGNHHPHHTPHSRRYQRQRRRPPRRQQPASRPRHRHQSPRNFRILYPPLYRATNPLRSNHGNAVGRPAWTLIPW